MPPNILYVFTNQQSATAMSCAGNPDLHAYGSDLKGKAHG